MKGSYASANKGYNALGTFEGVETSGKFLQRAEIPDIYLTTTILEATSSTF
jgi:hypothetical protein